jgi:hypothetical protein
MANLATPVVKILETNPTAPHPYRNGHVAVEPRSMNRQKLPPVNDLQKLVVLWIRVHQRAHVSGGLLGLKKRGSL